MHISRDWRRTLIGSIVCLAATAFSWRAYPQDSQFVAFPWSKQSMIAGPACLSYPQPWEGAWTACDEATHQAWLADVRRWRDERRIRVGLSDARYSDPRVGRARGAFMQAQAMIEDR